MTSQQVTQEGPHKVLIIGGYGTFGSRIARLLAGDPRLALLIAGRTLHKAESFIARHSNRAEMVPVAFDRDADVGQQISGLAPAFVVDASGPFQAYGDDPYRVFMASISCGAHYLDLADNAEFVCGIEAFDQRAKEANVFALSGASTCIALSSAVFRQLALDLERVEFMHGGIAPSPHAGVGYSVMQAVAHSAGQAVDALQQGSFRNAYPFTDSRHFVIAPPGYVPLGQRSYSLADVPDLRLARSIEPKAENLWFGAAPVPGVYHALLRVLARAVKRGWLRSLNRLAPLMYSVMSNLAWGEHRGGMFVEVRGVTNSGRGVSRSWHLIAEGDDGPSIPSLAAAAIIRNCLAGRVPVAGARPAVGELEPGDFKFFFDQMDIHIGTRDEPVPDHWPVFRTVLGNAWEKLPPAIRALHDIEESARFSGRATVSRGSSLLAGLIGSVAGFPPAAEDVPVEVTMTATAGREHWSRDFDGHKFSSVMTAGSGRFSHLVCEKFGPVSFAMALVTEDGRLNYVQRGWTFLGIPMPRFLGPQGDTCETVRDGRFQFQVEIKLPLVGHLVTYEGWLVAAKTTD